MAVVASPAKTPKVLLTDTDRRPYAARLALVLADLGCEVSAIYSLHGHPLSKTHVLAKTFPYHPFDPLNSLERAILSAKPDIIIPCDDRGVRHLHDLYMRAKVTSSAQGFLIALIERSLGPAESFPVVSGRYPLFCVAREEALPMPETRLIESEKDFAAWQAEQPFPWVLKADETWGGRGVRIAHSRREAERHFQELSRPFRFRRAIKRMVVNRDPFWLQPWWEGRRPAVVAQAYVPGRPANCAVVCWEGEVLAGTAVEVVSADGLTGPASVVRVVDSPMMMHCAQQLARRQKLSGFFGLDFVIEDSTKKVHLIEMNPRCTPLCHLRLGKGRDMMGALWGRLTGCADQHSKSITDNDLIAYFPQAHNSKSTLLDTSFHDVPEAGPELIREFVSPWPERTFLFRCVRQFDQWKIAVQSLLSGNSAATGPTC